MAKLSDLIPAMATAIDMAESSVAVYARHLRAVRLISTGGRGPGGAEMNAQDCANLLIACIASDQAKNSPIYVEASKYLLSAQKHISVTPNDNRTIDDIIIDNSAISFNYGLARLIKDVAGGKFDDRLDKTKRNIVNKISVTITRPLKYAGISSGVYKEDGDVVYFSSYHAVSIDGGDIYYGDLHDELFAQCGVSKKIQYMISVDQSVIFEIAEVLRSK